METSLHRALKDRYGLSSGGRSEVVWRISASTPWTVRASSSRSSPAPSVRSGPSSAGSCPAIGSAWSKPMVLEKRVVRRNRLDGPTSPHGAVRNAVRCRRLRGPGRSGPDLPDPNLASRSWVCDRRDPDPAATLARLQDRRSLPGGEHWRERPREVRRPLATFSRRPRLDRAILDGRHRRPHRSAPMARPAHGLLLAPQGRRRPIGKGGNHLIYVRVRGTDQELTARPASRGGHPRTASCGSNKLAPTTGGAKPWKTGWAGGLEFAPAQNSDLQPLPKRLPAGVTAWPRNL